MSLGREVASTPADEPIIVKGKVCVIGQPWGYGGKWDVFAAGSDDMRLDEGGRWTRDKQLMALFPSRADAVAFAKSVALNEWRENNACKICGNWPDECGMISHGRGCYTQSEDGGGESFVYSDPPFQG